MKERGKKKKKHGREMSEGFEEPSLRTPYHELFEIAMEGVCYGEDDSEYNLINLHATRKMCELIILLAWNDASLW